MVRVQQGVVEGLGQQGAPMAVEEGGEGFPAAGVQIVFQAAAIVGPRREPALQQPLPQRQLQLLLPALQPHPPAAPLQALPHRLQRLRLRRQRRALRCLRRRQCRLLPGRARSRNLALQPGAQAAGRPEGGMAEQQPGPGSGGGPLGQLLEPRLPPGGFEAPEGLASGEPLEAVGRLQLGFKLLGLPWGHLQQPRPPQLIEQLQLSRQPLPHRRLRDRQHHLPLAGRLQGIEGPEEGAGLQYQQPVEPADGGVLPEAVAQSVEALALRHRLAPQPALQHRILRAAAEQIGLVEGGFGRGRQLGRPPLLQPLPHPPLPAQAAGLPEDLPLQGVG